MNCEKAMQGYIASLTGETAVDAAIGKHLDGCAACRDASAEMTALWTNMGALPDVAPPARMRARFDEALSAWRETPAPARARAASGPGWTTRLAAAFAGWRPVPTAAAVALAVGGFALGHLVASRNSQIDVLRQELQSTRSMMALSLLQQRSPVDRLRAVGFTSQHGTPAPDVVDALFETLASDPNVDVRLAVVDALSGLSDLDTVRPRFVESLKQQSSPMVQIAIIDALVRLRDADAQTALRSIAADSLVNSTVRERARWAVQQLTL
jgi:HEAT repeat protein